MAWPPPAQAVPCLDSLHRALEPGLLDPEQVGAISNDEVRGFPLPIASWPAAVNPDTEMKRPRV